jgi:hypothetical protein
MGTCVSIYAPDAEGWSAFQGYAPPSLGHLESLWLRLLFAPVHCRVRCCSHSDCKGLSSWWRGMDSPVLLQCKDLAMQWYHMAQYQVARQPSEERAKPRALRSAWAFAKHSPSVLLGTGHGPWHGNRAVQMGGETTLGSSHSSVLGECIASACICIR